MPGGVNAPATKDSRGSIDMRPLKKKALHFERDTEREETGKGKTNEEEPRRPLFGESRRNVIGRFRDGTRPIPATEFGEFTLGVLPRLKRENWERTIWKTKGGVDGGQVVARLRYRTKANTERSRRRGIQAKKKKRAAKGERIFGGMRFLEKGSHSALTTLSNPKGFRGGQKGGEVRSTLLTLA